MLRTTWIVGGIFATVGMACGGTGDGSPEPVATSEARVTLSASGNGSTSETLTATSSASGEVLATRTVTVAAGSATLVDLQLPAGSYAFSVQAYDAKHLVLLGSGSVTASLAAGTTTDLKLATTIAASGGSAQVQGQANAAPEILGMQVDLPGQGSLSATAQGDTMAAVHVDAVSSVPGDLSFFWSGFGLSGAVQGSSTMDLSAAAAAAQASGPQIVRVVVEDALGDTAEASTTLNLAGSASAQGSASAEGASDAGSGASAGSSASCLDADAQCTAGCDSALAANPTAVAAHTSCEASCSLALASCGL
jgi:hypothetical protein